MKKIIITLILGIFLLSLVSATAGTGGTVTYYDNAGTNMTVHTFTSDGTFTVTEAGDISVLVVAGGGSGGTQGTTATSTGSGAGGAGGLLYNNSYSVSSGGNSVTVGAGGIALSTGSTGQGLNGGNSIFGTITATGGGGGGYRRAVGKNGGSGGGGGYNLDGGTGVSGQGYDGGDGSTDYGGPGGGGANEVGAASSGNNGGNGGDGKDYSSTFGTVGGDSGWFAGGGGGGSRDSGTKGIGGDGGGGDGGDNTDGSSATANTGGGGGGSGDGGHKGGNGGSGIVIISYESEDQPIYCTFSGYVKDEDGAALVGANVTVWNQYDVSEHYSNTTIAGGLWSLNITNSTNTYMIGGYYNNSLTGKLKPYISGTCSDVDYTVSNLSLCSSYTPPTYNSINFSLGTSDACAVDYYDLNITSPTIDNPVSVSSGDNITILFNVTSNGDQVISGVTMENVTIGGSSATILTGGVGGLYSIFYEDFEDGWVNSVQNTAAIGDCSQIGDFNACNNNGDDYEFGSSSDTSPDASHTGSRGFIAEDWDGGTEASTNGIWYTFNPSTSCNGGECDYIEVDFWFWEFGVDAGESCWVTEQDVSEAGTPSALETMVPSIDSYTNYIVNVSSGLLDSNNISIRIMCDMDNGADDAFFDDFNISGFSSGTPQQFAFIAGEGWQVNVTVPTFESGLKDLYLNATYSGNTYNETEINATDYGAADTCTCPGDGNNWEIDLEDYCVISDVCDLGTGNVTFINTGNITFNNELTACGIGVLPANQKGYLGSSSKVNLGGSC